MRLSQTIQVLPHLPAILLELRHPSKLDATELFRFAAASKVFPPLQLESEFVPFLEILLEMRPSTILEIGTHKGGTLFLLTRTLAQSGHIVSIDLPGGPFGGGFSPWRIPLYRFFSGKRQSMSLMRANSHLPGTVKQFEQITAGRLLDVLFIDGDHSYDGVKKDFEYYSPYVKAGGIIVFHDIVEGPMAGGVHALWMELKKQHRHREFVEDWTQGSCGIGILWKKEGHGR